MADNTDDWWDPAEPVWFGTPPENKTEYRILRARKIPVPGSPGFVIQWEPLESFDSKKDRDNKLRRINKEHPAWRLKTTEGNPYLEGLGVTTLPTQGINK